VAGVDRMTSVDSNVILAAVAQREEHHAAAVQLLRDARAEGPLFVSPVVYAELMASTRPAAMQDLLAMARISVAWSMPMDVWDLAGRSFGDYARRRRSGNLPRRLIADFLIAAHAAHHGLRVLTFDRTVYDVMFPHLLVASR
jgi:predicted nucleic acid-binding protein